MTSESGDPVPAIREEDATGEIASLFADLRGTLGVPVVNLVWRHLATMPGALPWAWARVRPLYADGTIAREAALVRADLPLPTLPPWPESVLRAAGIAAEDEARIRTVLASYDRSNAMNLVALLTLLMELDGTDGDGGERRGAPAAAELGSVVGELPRLLTLAEMAPATARLVQQLNLLGDGDDARILASMYRHLAHWPAFLALAWTLIAPLDADGRLSAVIAAGLKRARTHAGSLIPRLGPADSTLTAAVRAEMRTALHDFTTRPIGKMVVICALIRRAMPDAGAP